MNKREKTYVRNMEQGETQEELLKELKRYEEKDSAQSKLKQRDVLNKLMDKVSQNNQEKLVQKINFSGLSVLGDTSNDSEISFDEQVNNRSIQVQNMEKKFKKEIYIKNFDEVFKTERKKLTLKAFK